MLRRGFLTGLASLGVTTAFSADAQAIFRTVVEVDTADPQQMQRALNIVIESGRYHVAYREKAEIRVIAVGGGLAMLRSDVSPVLNRVIFVSRSLPMVTWRAAAEDVAAATAAEGAPPPLIQGVEIVENGRAEAARLQAEGWSLIRP